MLLEALPVLRERAFDIRTVAGVASPREQAAPPLELHAAQRAGMLRDQRVPEVERDGAELRHTASPSSRGIAVSHTSVSSVTGTSTAPSMSARGPPVSPIRTTGT